MTSSAVRSKNVAEVLGALDAPIRFAPNAGNAGDSLINLGTYQVLKEIGLEWEVLPPRLLSDVDGADTLVLGGGGGLSPHWPSSSARLLGAINRSRRVVLLPQTVHNVDGALQALRKQDILFLREMRSYQYCMSLRLRCQVMLDHDMALNVEPASVGAGWWWPNRRADGKPDKRWMLLPYNKIRRTMKRDVNAFRVDAEGRQTEYRPNRFTDLSGVGRVDDGDYDESLTVSRRFLTLVDMYQTIRTDRLHVAIAGALLNKRVIAWDNSYHKVRSVIEYSRLPVELEHARAAMEA